MKCAYNAYGVEVFLLFYPGTELKYNEVNHQMIKDDDILLKYSGKEPTLENVQCIRDQVLVKLPPKEESNSAGNYRHRYAYKLFQHTLYIHTYIYNRNYRDDCGIKGEESHNRSGKLSINCTKYIIKPIHVYTYVRLQVSKSVVCMYFYCINEYRVLNCTIMREY